MLPLAIESEIERLAPGGSPERLARIVHHDPSSLARIARVALQHLRWPRSENVEAVQTRARHEMVRLERGSDRSRSHHRHRAAAWFDRRGFGFGPRFLAASA